MAIRACRVWARVENRTYPDLASNWILSDTYSTSLNGFYW